MNKRRKERKKKTDERKKTRKNLRLNEGRK